MPLTRKEFIESIKAGAVAACKGTGLFPSLMIVQAIIESGNGNSVLAAKYFNFFGIKAGAGWNGRVAVMKTREVVKGKDIMVDAPFRAYETVEAGFKDRCNFLKVNPRYAKAGVFSAKTPEEQAEAFQKAGYATDPNYAKLLKSVLNGSINVKQYDKL